MKLPRYGLAARVGVMAAAVFSAVGGLGWYLLVFYFEDHNLGQLLLMVAALSVGCGLFLALLFEAMVFRHWRRLTTALEEAGRGRLRRLEESRGGRELEGAQRALNSLLARLADLEAAHIDSDLMREQARHEARLKEELEDKNRIIAETNASLSQRLAELELLFGLTKDLVGTLESEEVFRLLSDRIGRSLPGDGFLLLALDESRRSLRVAGATGVFLQVPAEELLDAQRGPVSEPLRKRRLVHYGDLAAAEDNPLCRRLGRCGSLLGAPLVHKNRSFGVIGLYRRQPAAFSENEMRLLELLARQASLALAAARLYQEKLDLSVTDDLTQVANRRQLHYRLELEWNRTRRFGGSLSVLMIDVDDFKRYNDRNGHLLGDRVLREVAEQLKKNTRNVDTVARFGGEEFVVILPGQGKPAAQAVAEKLRQAVAERSFPHGQSQPQGRVTISLGVATFPGDAESPVQLLERADLALYASKREGRNRTTVYRPELSAMAEERKRQQEFHRRPRRRRRNSDRLQLVDPT